ncbi:unnamed protein product [Boreogadus saida]
MRRQLCLQFLHTISPGEAKITAPLPAVFLPTDEANGGRRCLGMDQSCQAIGTHNRYLVPSSVCRRCSAGRMPGVSLPRRLREASGKTHGADSELLWEDSG